MTRDGCYACHSREGQGGISQLSRPFFKGTEDLGFEGSLPPDLSAVGARLQSSWLVSHLTFAERARPYVLARCVVLDQASAENWAQLFADADPVNLPATPTPTTASVKRGQQLAGNTGFQCITCHTLGKYPSPSIQGMDLGLQTRRMHFGTFQKWLQHPTMLRPGTRMPTFWAEANEAAEVDQTALWNWIALGDERPLPAGLVVEEGSFDLIPTTRPLLHGCSLSDLSARCMAVGGPGGAHYAYDLAHLRLAWLWRGDFLDAEGTWRGRILDELEPESEDWIVLPKEFPFTLMQEDHRNPKPKFLGWRLDEAGWPIMRVKLGKAEILDAMRSDWTLERTRFIREIRVLHAAVQVDLGQIEGLTISPSAFVLQAGETQKVNYSW
jgi:mono/diheme cytochrome c family protein